MIKRLAALVSLALLSACAGPETNTRAEPAAETTTPPVIGMANPASVHCERSGGRLEIRRESGSAGGEYGVCVFADGRQCEEWALFREGRCVAPR